ncbi:MAG TPA: methyltransferase [Thermoanaerobaculia bacterium]|nr:methyltransferase [Thermoanaerobaculia bacterium]
MKYGVRPTNLLERLALAVGRVPVPALDALYSIVKARCLMTAVRLGLFEALTERSKTAAELAAEKGLDAEATELLLRSLVFLDYLELRRGRFRLSRLARRSLVAGSPQDLRGFVEWTFTQWSFLEQMEPLVRTGRGVDFHHTMTDTGEWAWYQRAMLEVARFDAPAMAGRVPVPKGATRLLDLAGSHGLLGAEICRRHPPMRSVVVDLPQALEHARVLAKEAGIADLVEHREGEALTAELGEGYDVALVANLLHHFEEEPCRAILERARRAVRPGGTVAVWEIEAPRPGTRPAFGDGVALFFRLTSTARAHHGEDYAAWLEAAGCRRTKVIRPALSPGNVLVVARVP